MRAVDDYMAEHHFTLLFSWTPKYDARPGLNIRPMERYIFRVYDYPSYYRYSSEEEKADLLLDSRLALRAMLEERNGGFVYSFWPDVLTLKEIGDPRDIAAYFRLWDDTCPLLARNIVTQCRQNTNYDIVRYAAHPFFLQGYTVCVNGENTFYTKNKEFQKSLHRGYTGFESDSQCLLYSLHYVLHELRWPPEYFKHVITPLPFAEIDGREDADVLRIIKEYNIRGEIHRVFSPLEYAEKFLEYGLYMGIGPQITYPDSEKLTELARIMPLDRLLLETDAPFLAPAHIAGQDAFPDMISFVAEKISQIRKDVSPQEVVDIALANTKKLYSIK